MKDNESQAPSSWVVYIIRTASGMLYTGITTDLQRRLQEHAGSDRGAKSLRGKGPLKLVFSQPASDRSEASILEVRIKQLKKPEKLALIDGDGALLGKIKSKG